jgi:tRNA A-37 threonylcarbamoyl transferase component Bud32
MSGKRGIGNIADLLHSLLPSLVDEDIDFFLSRYKAENPDARWEIEDARHLVEDRIKSIEEKRLKSRTRRCFKNSSEFTVEKRRDAVIYAARPVEIDEIRRILRDFADGAGKVIKRDKKATIALLRSGPEEICVKAYTGLTLSEKIRAMLRSSRGHVSWRSARALNLRGFETPRQLCLVIARRLFVPRAIYLASASIRPGLEMDRFILTKLAGNARAITSFAGALGTLVGRLHRAGVYHRDLKGTNIAVRRNGTGFAFSLLDLDGVTFGREVSARRRAKNLAQIYLSTPGAVDAEARRGFCEAYGKALDGQGGRDAVWRRVREMVRGRDILYVGPAGDVTEDGRTLFDELWGGQSG